MKPSLPQGTRDFGPSVVRKRNYIFNTIRSVFELSGFQPLETPAMENLETLMGKYGEEGDKLIFRILNNGLDNPSKQEQLKDDFEQVLQGKNSKGITERALKYDLTIPFARYVAMNYGQLTLPFKRYQIQPVWRADRPQKGRYREFYQCDADIVGSKSLLNEVELANIYSEVFSGLKIADFRLHLNSRNLLKGIMEVCGLQQLEKKILIIIDKSDKIGLDGVKEELNREGLNTDALQKLMSVYSLEGTNADKIKFLNDFLKSSTAGLEGLREISFVLDFLESAGSETLSSLYIDLTLARGLEYYTGLIFEAKAPATVRIGSIGGGGRYDDLTGLFGVPNIPGVGISFGVDRIYDVMEELNLFPEDLETSTKVLFFNLGENESKAAYSLMQNLRKRNISAELYHEQAKMDKQFKYAEKKKIPYVIIIGEKEISSGHSTIKNLATGEQKQLTDQQLLEYGFE